jgi:TRAP-type C4-dicarboxylate transport system permease small subunit
MERLYKAINLVGYIGLLSTMLLLTINVCSRKLGWPVPGTYSIVTVIAVFLAVPAIINAQRQGAHIIIDALKSKFSPVTLKILETFADICAVGIWGFAGWVGINYAEHMWEIGEVVKPLEFPAAPFRFIWAIGLLLISFVILVVRFSKLRRKDRQ